MADFLVVGAGVAGLRAAIELASAGSVLVVAKDTLRESSSEYAQGGIAAALSDDDEVSLHEQDTLVAGDGLCNPETVHILVEEGPAVIEELVEWGAEFDREGGRFQFAKEGAHSRSRVLHAHGDSTGQEIARTLYQKAATLPSVQFATHAAMTDLLLADDGGVAGAVLFGGVEVHAKAVLLATGGLGRVFQNTTNPDVATGDGVAAAWRAGAEISDIEFVQFHPTALYVKGAPRFLLSEALRGEGAHVCNALGERFLSRYHPLAELAPRDVVSRAIVLEMQRTSSDHVLLDLTHLNANQLRERFPRIYQTCLQYGVDITRQPVPVQPAAHYAMGGIKTDSNGSTSVARLFAAGEAACTGVHGANRLASNSLLEGVVFGARAGRAMPTCARTVPAVPSSQLSIRPNVSEADLRSRAWNDCGILRSGQNLARLLQLLDQDSGAGLCQTVSDFELRNIHSVTGLIARCALARHESRGAHYRLDYPEKSIVYQKHSVVSMGNEVRFH